MRALILLTVLLLTGCENPLAPAPIPDGAVALEPDRLMASASLRAEFWQEVETDSGRSGDLSRIQWFRVPGGPWTDKDGLITRGLWVRSGHRIYLAENYLTDPQVVKHEMLHDLLDDPSHSHPLFSTAEYKKPYYAL